jgi:general secretion pathway protein G
MRRTTTNRGLRAGFTLIELLLVLVILAVLAAVVVPKFTGQSERARETRAQTDISTLEGQLERFEIDAGRYPTNDEGLDALINRPGNVKEWNGPYIKQVPKDPWNNPYVYRYPGTHHTTGFDLFSMGKDGREGNDDIDNWTQK